MTHHYTCSDALQPVSPRIPQPPRVAQRLTCSESIERRVRTLLTWHAGGCGLITEFAADSLARLVFGDLLTLDDLRTMTTPAVFVGVVAYMSECVVKEVKDGSAKD